MPTQTRNATYRKPPKGSLACAYDHSTKNKGSTMLSWRRRVIIRYMMLLLTWNKNWLGMRSWKMPIGVWVM